MTKKIAIITLLMLVALQAMGRNERDTLGVGTQVVFVRNDGQWDSRVRYEAQLHDAALFLEANPIPLKRALYHLGRMGDGLRLPLTPLGPLDDQKLVHVLDTIAPAERAARLSLPPSRPRLPHAA